MENKKRLVGPLEQVRTKPRSHDASPLFQREGVGELPQDKISQKNGQHPKAFDNFHSRNNDGGRKSQGSVGALVERMQLWFHQL